MIYTGGEWEDEGPKNNGQKVTPLLGAPAVLSSSPDGFLRMALTDLLSVEFTHLISGLDEKSSSSERHGESVTWIGGYTEWIGSDSHVGVSLGWDWRLEVCPRSGTQCVRFGLPRSNIMLVDAEHQDYGWNRNLHALATVVDALPWTEQTLSAIELC
ncbi:DUF4902 domain-containing protein [Roseateles flavus]|uniref:DUF4902 domain-containing protein n=1 Tax=Roseateles flavus TaxID=3149041 RepID=A0ABV0GKP1_9BURK